MNEIEKEFRRIDLDNNGFISPSEMKQALARHEKDFSDFEMEGMIKLADVNGDGQLDYEEFSRLYGMYSRYVYT